MLFNRLSSGPSNVFSLLRIPGPGFFLIEFFISFRIVGSVSTTSLPYSCKASSLFLSRSFNSLVLNMSRVLHIGCISLEFAFTVTSKKTSLRIRGFQRLLFSEADRRDRSLRLRQHRFGHLAEISKKPINHSGAKQVRLVNAASHQPTLAF